jgi:hydroxymethylpyrimidine pyrophosphatase-like HAD family hydrolase
MSTVGTLAISDLDRTLLYSTSALLLPPDAPAPALRCVEHYEGAPLSFVTERAAALLAQLVARSCFVPITTRTVAQLQRVRGPIADAEWAICANGGRLLRHAVEDAAFTAAVTARLDGLGAPLAEMRDAFTRLAAEHAVAATLRTADDLFCYAVVDRPTLPDGWIVLLAASAESLGWTVSLQGRKVYCVPAGLTKAAAARDLADRLGADRIVAAGDSLLDAGLLEAADRAIRPAHGELADAGWQRESVAVTASSGVLAGEEIALWFTREV